MHADTDENSHFICLIIKCFSVIFIVVNIYGYNCKSDNDQLLCLLEERLTHWLSKFPDSYLIIGGDFNVVLNESIDRWPPRRPSNLNTNLKLFMDRFHLIDIWREKNVDDTVYTWSNKDGSRRSRIDFWLVSNHFDENNILVNVLPTPLTDHKAILITMNISPNTNCNKYNSYWKMNSSLLKLSAVRQELGKLINYYWIKAKKEGLFCHNWELLKFEIGKYLRKFSSTLVKSHCLMEEKVVSEILAISNISVVDLVEGQRLRITELQNELDNMYKMRAQGAFLRSRQKWLEHGEQMSAYFFKS